MNQTVLMKPKLIGTAEASRILSQGRATTLRQAASGALPVYERLDDPSGAYIYDRAAIEAVAADRAVAARAREAVASPARHGRW